MQKVLSLLNSLNFVQFSNYQHQIYFAPLAMFRPLEVNKTLKSLIRLIRRKIYILLLSLPLVNRLPLQSTAQAVLAPKCVKLDLTM